MLVVTHREFSQKGGRVKSVAKTAANRAKIARFWKQVRRGEVSAPRRGKVFPEPIHALAKRYLWWQTSLESLKTPQRVVAQVMNLGTAEDCITLEEYFGQEAMCQALRAAEPGWFRERSWTFWHYRLGLTPWGDEPPPLPERTYVA